MYVLLSEMTAFNQIDLRYVYLNATMPKSEDYNFKYAEIIYK